MSDPDPGEAENFLQRWSRRKQVAEARSDASGEPEATEAESSPDVIAQSAPELPAFDAATLPPIESITATSDIRAFLAPGVPEELLRAALRRAWVSDPTIRDFIGIAENQGDFTKPDTMLGFGSLENTPELRRIVDRLFGLPTEHFSQCDELDKSTAEASAKLPSPSVLPAVGATPQSPEPEPNDAVAEAEYVGTDTPPRRKHGGALPK
jgi:Protein of unknown function (DUF3306)